MPNPCLSTPSRRSEGDLNKSINTHKTRIEKDNIAGAATGTINAINAIPAERAAIWHPYYSYVFIHFHAFSSFSCIFVIFIIFIIFVIFIIFIISIIFIHPPTLQREQMHAGALPNPFESILAVIRPSAQAQ